MDWRTTYPSLEALGLANFETLNTWCESLPKPQTDVERTVWRRLGQARHEAMRTELHRMAPDVAKSFDDVMEMARKILGKV